MIWMFGAVTIFKMASRAKSLVISRFASKKGLLSVPASIGCLLSDFQIPSASRPCDNFFGNKTSRQWWLDDTLLDSSRSALKIQYHFEILNSSMMSLLLIFRLEIWCSGD